MKQFLLGFLLLALTSCGSIPVDSTTPPMDGNLFTLEMASCNKRDVGILGCDTDLEEGILEIPVVFGGEIQIKSDNCNFSDNKKYGGTQVLTYKHSTLLAARPSTEKSCIFDVKVFVNGFDKGVRGEFFLSDKEFGSPQFTLFGQQFQGLGWVQIKEGTDLVNAVEFKMATPGIIFWECAGKKGEKHFTSDPKISLQEIFKGYVFEKDSCYLNVGILPDDPKKEALMAKIAISIFDKSIVSLSEPKIYMKGDYLKVEADTMVAGIQIGEKFKVTKGTGIKRAKAKVKEDEEVLVRLITAGGRYMLLKVKNGEVLWKNYIKY